MNEGNVSLNLGDFDHQDQDKIKELELKAFSKKMDQLIERWESEWSEAGSTSKDAMPEWLNDLAKTVLEAVKQKTLKEYSIGEGYGPESYAVNIIDTCKENGFFQKLRDAFEIEVLQG